MADKTLIYGSTEYVDVEVDCTTPGVTFTYTEWEVDFAFALVGASFNSATATWYDGALTQVSSVDYARILVGTTVDLTAGDYRIYLKLTKSGGTEAPIIKAAGLLKVTAA